MGVSSVRFNAKEEKIIKILSLHFHCDYSSLVKKSLFDMYEDLKDREFIESFEKKESKKKEKFLTAQEILKK